MEIHRIETSGSSIFRLKLIIFCFDNGFTRPYIQQDKQEKQHGLFGIPHTEIFFYILGILQNLSNLIN